MRVRPTMTRTDDDEDGDDVDDDNGVDNDKVVPTVTKFRNMDRIRPI